jgi:hypothetical protein
MFFSLSAFCQYVLRDVGGRRSISFLMTPRLSGDKQQNFCISITSKWPGFGTGSMPMKAIELRQPHRIHELASRFIHAVETARRWRTDLTPGGRDAPHA